MKLLVAPLIIFSLPAFIFFEFNFIFNKNIEIYSKKNSQVTGIYSLMKVDQNINPQVLDLQYVKGVSVRVSWRLLEPEYKKYNWSYIDNVLMMLEGTDKKVMLRVLPGVNSPDWIYTKGVKKIEFTPVREKKRLKFGNVVSTPLMWDKKYINFWNEFIRALAERYNDNSRIVMIHMAGPTVYSAEMHLLKTPEGKKLLYQAQYSKNKIVTAWKAVIDNYSNSFTNKRLSLNIAIPFKVDGSLEEIINYSFAKIRSKIAIQGNWLKAKTSSNFIPYKTIKNINIKVKKCLIGFQMARASKNNLEFQGSLEDSVKMGLNVGSKYFELYQKDILDKSNMEYLIYLNNLLSKETIH